MIEIVRAPAAGLGVGGVVVEGALERGAGGGLVALLVENQAALARRVGHQPLEVFGTQLRRLFGLPQFRQRLGGATL